MIDRWAMISNFVSAELKENYGQIKTLQIIFISFTSFWRPIGVVATLRTSNAESTTRKAICAEAVTITRAIESRHIKKVAQTACGNFYYLRVASDCCRYFQ